MWGAVVTAACATSYQQGLGQSCMLSAACVQSPVQHTCCGRMFCLAGSGLEEEARLRQRTLYMPWGFVPMFPASLASSLFSLTNQPIAASSAAAGGGSDGEAPDTGCCAMSVGAELAPDGSLSNWEITPSLIRVTHSLTYDEADEDLLAGPEGARHPQLQQLYEAATARKLWRVAQGSIDIDAPGERG